METTVRQPFTPAQIEILNAMSSLHTEEDILELKQAIADFFFRRADKEKSPQLLPPDGLYRTENEKGELVRLEIKNGRICDLPDCEKVKFI